MSSAGTGKSKDQILLSPMEALSQCQTLIFTDGTFGSKTPEVYMSTYRVFVPGSLQGAYCPVPF